jgi:hypothetical protein
MLEREKQIPFGFTERKAKADFRKAKANSLGYPLLRLLEMSVSGRVVLVASRMWLSSLPTILKSIRLRGL